MLSLPPPILHTSIEDDQEQQAAVGGQTHNNRVISHSPRKESSQLDDTSGTIGVLYIQHIFIYVHGLQLVATGLHYYIPKKKELENE